MVVLILCIHNHYDIHLHVPLVISVLSICACTYVYALCIRNVTMRVPAYVNYTFLCDVGRVKTMCKDYVVL
jgi:hypothetical protein